MSVLQTIVVFLVMTGMGDAFDETPPDGLIREIRAGMVAHDVDGLWSGESKEEGPDLCVEAIFNWPLFRLLYATAYPNLGVSLNTQGDTSKVYGGLLLQWEPSLPIFFSAGVGVAIHDGQREKNEPDRKALGSRVLFRIPLEVGYAFSPRHRIIIAFDHLSNAYLASPNEGLDTLGLIYGYRF